MEADIIDGRLWLKEVGTLAPIGSGKQVYAKVETGIVIVYAKTYQLGVSDNSLYLAPLGELRLDSPQIAVLMPLPTDGATFYKRANEKGDLRYQVRYLAYSARSRFGEAVAVTISTALGFLEIADSEAQIQ